MLSPAMRTHSTVAALALATLPACSGLSTSFDYDTSHTFVGLHSYAWIEKQDNSIGMKRVREAVDAEMKERGYALTTDKPDFQVAAYIGTQDKLRVVDWGYTYQPHGYWHGGHDIDVYQYEEGTLVLDVIDPAKSELIWRGSASKAVDRSWTPEERDKEVREAVRALLDEFPPKSGG